MVQSVVIAISRGVCWKCKVFPCPYPVGFLGFLSSPNHREQEWLRLHHLGALFIVLLFHLPSSPCVLPKPKEDCPPPPPGDGCQVTPPWGTVLPLYTSGQGVSVSKHMAVRGDGQMHNHAPLACHHTHKSCGDMHHHAQNSQRPAPEQVPLWSGCTSHLSRG